MQSAQQRQQYARQQLEQIAEQIEAFESDRRGVEQKLAEVGQSLGAETQELSRLTEELEEYRRQIEQRQQAFADAQLRLAQTNKEVEQHKAAILDLMRQLAQVNSRLGHIEIERKNFGTQQTRLAERRQIVVTELESLESQRAASQEELDGAVAQMQGQQEQLEERRSQATQLGQQLAQISEQLGAAREHRSGLLSRQKLLKDLEAKREGVSEGVKSVLRQRDEKFPFIRGLVADVLRVDVEHAHTIEAALDGRDQWLVTNELAAAASEAREPLEELEGRVNVLSVDRLSRADGVTYFQPDVFEHGLQTRVTGGLSYDWNQHKHRIRLAIDLVRFEPADQAIAEHLLGKTVVVDDLAVARDLHESGPRGWRYVTRSGEVLEADGTLRAGPLTAAMGLLSRRSELEAIAQQIADVDARIAELSAKLSDGSAAAKTLEEKQNALRNEIYRLNTIKVELTSRIARNNDQQSALRREQPVLDRELEVMLDQVGKLKTEETLLSEQRAKMDADQSHAAAAGDRSDGRSGDTFRRSFVKLGEELTATRVQLGQIQEKQLALQQQVQRQTAAKAELEQQVQRIKSVRRMYRTVMADRRSGSNCRARSGQACRSGAGGKPEGACRADREADGPGAGGFRKCSCPDRPGRWPSRRALGNRAGTPPASNAAG